MRASLRSLFISPSRIQDNKTHSKQSRANTRSNSANSHSFTALGLARSVHRNTSLSTTTPLFLLIQHQAEHVEAKLWVL